MDRFCYLYKNKAFNQILCNITWNKTIEKLKRNQNI